MDKSKFVTFSRSNTYIVFAQAPNPDVFQMLGIAVEPAMNGEQLGMTIRFAILANDKPEFKAFTCRDGATYKYTGKVVNGYGLNKIFVPVFSQKVAPTAFAETVMSDKVFDQLQAGIEAAVLKEGLIFTQELREVFAAFLGFECAADVADKVVFKDFAIKKNAPAGKVEGDSNET